MTNSDGSEKPREVVTQGKSVSIIRYLVIIIMKLETIRRVKAGRKEGKPWIKQDVILSHLIRFLRLTSITILIRR